MAASVSCEGAYECGRSGDASDRRRSKTNYQPSSADVNVAPGATSWGAFPDASAVCGSATTPHCRKDLPTTSEKSAHTTVAAKTAKAGMRDLPRSFKCLEGVLEEDALTVVPPSFLTEPELTGVQAHALATVAAPLSAGFCTLRGSDLKAALLSTARNCQQQAMRDAFSSCMSLEVWADMKRKQGKVLFITLGEA